MWIFFIIGGIIVIFLFFFVKNKIWDEPHEQIINLMQQIKTSDQLHNERTTSLQNDISKLQQLHKEELELLYKRIDNIDNNNHAEMLKKELVDTVSCYAWKEINELCNKEYAFLKIPKFYSYRISKEDVTKNICIRFCEAIEEQYKYRYIILLYPQLKGLFEGTKIKISIPSDFSDYSINNDIFETVNFLKSKNNEEKFKDLILSKQRLAFLESTQSNLTAIPYMAKIMADYETYGLEHLAKELDWGYSYERLKKVKSIREIRKDAQAMVEKCKEAYYQLAYLLELFPTLQDIIECDYSQLPPINVEELSEYDATKDWISKEEYQSLSVTERNQLALDRYKNSHNKSKWQIGRDYELFIGYQCTLKGYNVDYFGSYMGLEDLGRDLIAEKDGKIIIIQCKYWSSKKLIHEKHITQLYGTMMSYCIENNCKKSNVKGVLVTNIILSDTAKKMAKFLGIKYREKVKLGDYPCIKCNINHNEFGETKIYHLPFDQKYDVTKINKKGEFYATTVAEAEKAGFRRAFKWFSN